MPDACCSRHAQTVCACVFSSNRASLFFYFFFNIYLWTPPGKLKAKGTYDSVTRSPFCEDRNRRKMFPRQPCSIASRGPPVSVAQWIALDIDIQTASSVAWSNRPLAQSNLGKCEFLDKCDFKNDELPSRVLACTLSTQSHILKWTKMRSKPPKFGGLFTLPQKLGQMYPS